MRRQMGAQILLAPRRVRAQRNRAPISGTGVAELMGAQRLQVRCAEATLVTQELRVCGVRHLLVAAKPAFPLEALAADVAVERCNGRVLGRVQTERRFGGESLIAGVAVERFGVTVAWQVVAELCCVRKLLIAEVACGVGAGTSAEVEQHLGGFVAFERTARADVLLAWCRRLALDSGEGSKDELCQPI